jgi:hypothetical protein
MCELYETMERLVETSGEAEEKGGWKDEIVVQRIAVKGEIV